MRALVIAILLLAPGTASASTLVKYSRSGGIAGEQTSLVVKRDRHATRKSTREGERKFRLGKKRYASLRTSLKAADFESLDPEYGSTMIADGIDVSVTFKGFTVVVHNDGDPPERLAKVLAKLYKLSQ